MCDPGQSVRVIEQQIATLLQQVHSRTDGLSSEEIVFQAQLRHGTHFHQRICEGEDDQVVFPGGVMHEGPGIIHDQMHTRILVRPCRMICAAQIGNDRIDFHSIHSRGTTQQRRRHIIARTGADHQHVLGWWQVAVRTILVGSEVEGFF